MLHLLLQTTQPSGSYTDLFEKLTAFIGALTALIVAIRSWYNGAQNRQAISNLANATADVATTPQGQPLPHVDPATVPTLQNIAQGGTGH